MNIQILGVFFTSEVLSQAVSYINLQNAVAICVKQGDTLYTAANQNIGFDEQIRLQKLEEEKTVLADYFNRDDIDPENIASKSQELKQTSDKIDILEARWEELVEKME